MFVIRSHSSTRYWCSRYSEHSWQHGKLRSYSPFLLKIKLWLICNTLHEPKVLSREGKFSNQCTMQVYRLIFICRGSAFPPRIRKVTKQTWFKERGINFYKNYAKSMKHIFIHESPLLTSMCVWFDKPSASLIHTRSYLYLAEFGSWNVLCLKKISSTLLYLLNKHFLFPFLVRLSYLSHRQYIGFR